MWETVTDWIKANHPTDLGAMISPDGSAPVLDARSIDLWRSTPKSLSSFTPRDGQRRWSDPDWPSSTTKSYLLHEARRHALGLTLSHLARPTAAPQGPQMSLKPLVTAV